MLGEQRQLAETAEERRIFYVAMTRAKERLILSGAAKLDAENGGSSAPIAWIVPALESAGVEPTILRTEEVLQPAESSPTRPPDV